MSEMVERVAAAIWADAGFSELHPLGFASRPTEVRKKYLSFAKAAIAAMREPTDGMFAVVKPYGLCMSGVHDIWRDMADAAINEPEVWTVP